MNRACSGKRLARKIKYFDERLLNSALYEINIFVYCFIGDW